MSNRALTAGVKAWKMWFALLGGAFAWGAHLLLAYAISEFGCVAGWGHLTILAISAISWLLIAVSVTMIAVAAGALIVSYRIGRQIPQLPPDPDDYATAAYVARFGMITNGLFVFIIVIESVPIFFYLGHC